jgi:hypothetical protein
MISLPLVSPLVLDTTDRRESALVARTEQHNENWTCRVNGYISEVEEMHEHANITEVDERNLPDADGHIDHKKESLCVAWIVGKKWEPFPPCAEPVISPWLAQPPGCW